MDPLSITLAAIALIEATAGACKTIKTIKDLPKAFEHVENHLPLVQRALGNVKTQLKSQSFTFQETQSFEKILQACCGHAEKLNKIFIAFEQRIKKEKLRDWKKLRQLFSTILQTFDGRRVESLMKDILKDLEQLSLYKSFELATREDMEEIKKALGDLSQVESAMEDSGNSQMISVSNSQNVASGGSGQQNNTQGGNHTFNSGNIHIGQKSARTILPDGLPNPGSAVKDIVKQNEEPLRSCYEWIFSNDDFKRWRYEDDRRLLWIKGSPGKGKTMLLCGIIETMKEDYQSKNSQAWCPVCFFCRATDAKFNTAESVMQSLLAFLFDKYPDLREKYGEQRNAYLVDWFTIIATIQKVLQDLPREGVFLIVDALDECVHSRQKLLEALVELSEEIPEKVKILVSSRCDIPDIEEELGQSEQIIQLSLEKTQASISHAVDSYIADRFDSLVKRKRYSNDLRKKVWNHLVSNPNNTFLWVALVCKELAKCTLNDTAEEKLADKFPPALDQFYKKMLGNIDALSENPVLCKKMLAIACAVYRPVSWREMKSLFGSTTQNTLTSVIGLCGSFLSIQEVEGMNDDDKIIAFVHLSARDFLLGNQDASKNILPHGLAHQHHHISKQSLMNLSARLKHDIYGLSDPACTTKKVTPPKPDPLASVRYSCVYWLDHLLELCGPPTRSSAERIDTALSTDPEGKAPDEMINGGIIRRLVGEKYLGWLEALTWVSYSCVHWLNYLLELGKPPTKASTECIGIALSTDPDGEALDEMVKDEGIVHNFFIEKYLYWLEALSLLSAIPVGVRAMERLENFLGKREQRRLYDLIRDAWRLILSHKEGIEIAPLQVYESALMFSPRNSLIRKASIDTYLDRVQPEPKIKDNWDACLQTIDGQVDMDSGAVGFVVFSNDDQQFLTPGQANNIAVWDSVSGKRIQQLEGHRGHVSTAAFSPNGKRIASGSNDRRIKLWNTESGKCTKTLRGHEDRVDSVTFSLCSEKVASSSKDQTIKIWNAKSGDCTHTLKNGMHRGSWTSVAFSSHDHRLLSCSSSRIVLWDINSCTWSHQDIGALAHASSSDGQQVVFGDHSGYISVWDVTSDPMSRTQLISGHQDFIAAVNFSKDSKRVVSSSEDLTIKIWDLISGACLHTFEDHGMSSNVVTFSNDNQRLASVSWRDEIKIWDISRTTSGNTAGANMRHASIVTSVALSSDGRRVASGSQDKKVKIWDADSGDCLKTFSGHDDDVEAVAWSSDGHRVASGSRDDTVKVWEVDSGRCLLTLNSTDDDDHECENWDTVALSNDGQLVAAKFDNTVCIWDVHSGDRLKTFQTGQDLDHLSFDANNPNDFSKLRCDVNYHGIGRLGIDETRQWITENGQNVFWLPPEYYPWEYSVAGSKIAIGCKSGQVLILGLVPKS